MYFWSTNTQNTINELLKKDDLQLTELLSEASLTNSIRSPSQELTKYLLRKEIIDELFDWLLTAKYKSDPKGPRYSRAALRVFTNCQNTLQKNFDANEEFINRLTGFIKTGENDGFIVGHFQRIIESYARIDHDFFKKFTNLFEYLKNNMQLMGICELFYFLMTETNFKDLVSDEMWLDLVKKDKGDDGFFVIAIIIQILRKNSEYIYILKKDAILEELMDTVINTQNNMLKAEIFEMIELIYGTDTRQNVIIQKYAENYKYENNCSLSGAIKVFRQITKELVDFIFIFPISTFVLEAFVNVFKEKSIEEKNKIIKENNLHKRLMENALSNKSEGQLVELCVAISSEKLEVTSEWKQFYSKKIHEKLKNRKKKYGGKLRRQFFDSDDEGKTDSESDSLDVSGDEDDDECISISNSSDTITKENSNTFQDNLPPEFPSGDDY